jgi:hypothetical protein
MKRLAIFVLALLSALPASASFRVDGGGTLLTWFGTRPTAEATTYRDALLWHYNGAPLDGLLATAARPSVALTSVGGGNSELAISMPLAAGNTWVAALALGPCPTANTDALRRTCVDPMIKADLKRVWDDYQRFLATPPPAAPDI